MVMKVDQELCAGCGACMDVCSAGAIHLVDYLAEIDNTLCTACEECVEACPNGAICAITIPSSISPPEVVAAVEYRENPSLQPTALPESAAPSHNLKQLAGTVLTFLGSEVAPRLMDVLVNALERRFAQQTTASITPSPSPSRIDTVQHRGKRRQIRYRQGRNGKGNFKGRR